MNVSRYVTDMDLFDHLGRVGLEFEAARDPDAARAMSAYMKHRADFFGIKTVARRAMQREITAASKKAEPEAILALADLCWDRPEREWQYLAADLLRKNAKRLAAGMLERVERYIVERSWWDTVDLLAIHVVGVIVRRHPERTATMDAWVHDDNMWRARTAVLHQITYKADTDIDRLFGYCDTLAESREFFIRKALGWALRTYAAIDPDAIRAFVSSREETLSGLTKREARKHL